MARTALSLDLGMCSLTAAIRDNSGDHRLLAVDGHAVGGASLVVGEDLEPRIPRPGDDAALSQLGAVLTRLGAASPAVIEDTAWPFAELLKVLLDPVVEHARTELGGRIDDIAVVVPCWWSPKQRHTYDLALRTALARPVLMVPSDKALAFALPTPALGKERTIIDAGASALSAVIVAGGRRGPRIVRSGTVEAGGDIFDRLLLADALTAAGYEALALQARWAWVGVPRVRAARLQLADIDPVTVELPPPVERIILSGNEVDAIGTAFFDSLLIELFTKLRSEPDRTVPVYLCGGLALDPAVVNATEQKTGHVRVVADPAHLASRGALRFLEAAVDSTDDPALPRTVSARPRRRSPRRARWVAGGLVGAAVIIAGLVFWPSASSSAPEWSDADAKRVALAVLPQGGAVTDLYLKQWVPDGGLDAQTVVRGPSEALTLSCGGDQRVLGPEQQAVRWQAMRVFVASPTAAEPSDRDHWDWSHVGTSVVTDATVLTGDSGSVWRNIERANKLCPSTAVNVVRNIVAVAADHDPGPPTYARDESTPALTQTTAATKPTATAVAGGGVAVGPNRLAWRGLISAAQTGTGKGLNVTCVASLDGVLVRRSCAAAAESADADRLASMAMAAMNPIPRPER